MRKSKSSPILLSVGILLAVSLACTVSGTSLPTSDSALGTMAASTIYAGLSQTVATVTSINSSETPTPALPTDTATPTLSPTPVFTPTPLVPQLSVSVATNCRIGPGKVYARVGALMVGESAEIVGRNPEGTYWFIRNPDSNTSFCWVWGEYATISGPTVALPVFTPPPTPTPTPEFTIVYAGMDTCVGWWVEFKLHNEGETTFRSIAITVKDKNTDTSVSMESNDFTNVDGCTDSTTDDSIPVGKTRMVSAPAFAYDPTGHKLHATITLCTETKQRGICTSDEIDFKP